jgi:thiamine-phosphate pyrophosphorylase
METRTQSATASLPLPENGPAAESTPIQLREKDLPLTELQFLAARIVQAVRAVKGKTRVLVNGPAQLALDVGADGVHLHANAGPAAVRAAQQVYARANLEPVISAACHTPDEIKQATGASMLLFSPVFEKVTMEGNTRGQGLAALRAAVDLANPTPVLALGGITEKNAAACVQNGAVGIAAIRLFLSDAWRSLLELAPASVRPSS